MREKIQNKIQLASNYFRNELFPKNIFHFLGCYPLNIIVDADSFNHTVTNFVFI